MKKLEEIVNEVKATIEKTNKDIRDGEKYLKDPILHQFYEGRVLVLRKKKQEFTRILVELEELTEKLVNSTKEDNEEVEEDNTEKM